MNQIKTNSYGSTVNGQNSSTTLKTVKILPDSVPIEKRPTQSVPAVGQTTGKLELRDALRERVARSVIEQTPTEWQYVKPMHTFYYDGEHFTLDKILGVTDGIMWVKAERSSTGTVWFNGIPEQTEFKTVFYHPI